MGKDKKEHRKKSVKHKKHKRPKHVSSSGSSSSCEDEWVEAPSSSTSNSQSHENKPKEKVHSDDWITNLALSASVTRDELRQSSEKKKDKNEDDKYMLDKLGQTNRELNPYWKDGGSGLPAENPVSVDSLRQASVTVGDQGAAWLRKALQRAREQAKEQNCSVEQIVAERWGSLEKLESMIAAAEERDKNTARSKQEYKYKYRSEENQSRERYNDYKSKEEEKDMKNERFNRDNKDSRNKYAKRNVERDDSNDSSSDSDVKNKSESYSKSVKSDRNKEQNRRGKSYSSKSEKSSKPEKKSFAKPANSSSDDSSDDQHKRHSKSSKEKNSRNRFFKPPCDSSEDDRENYKKHERRSKERVSSKRFSKPSSSSRSSSGGSSEDEQESHRNDKMKRFDRGREYKKSVEKESRRGFVKPRRNSEEEFPSLNRDNSRSDNHRSYSSSRKSFSSSSKGWRKKVESEDKDKKSTSDQKLESKIHSDEETSRSTLTEEPPAPEIDPVLTDKEMNDLGAKLLKAELLGNQELAEELKVQLEKARTAKASRPREAEAKEEVVLLTHTDSKGFTRPVSLGGPLEPTGGRRKAKKVETHSGGKRMRYFADDDKYTLQEMFQREKLSTVEDSNEVFAKLASKGVGRDDSARDMEDVFEETARMEESEGRKQARDRQEAIKESKKTARSLDNCQWCLESHQMLKHLIVAIGKTCYLCVPPYQSLTENHCLIVPSHHTTCATLLDEDVWAEMKDFRKSVVEMFLTQDEDVVFFESARYLNRFPHMVLNCVPMPKETGDLAPIYFKKAIQECEMEWSNNKKLVDLRGKDVRRAVPKGLPYFAVDFGMDSGFAHVIEDEKLFPQNFAQEIIGGMLDLDHTIWRKQRKQTFEEQSKKVIQLTKLWSPFDFTKNK